MSRLIDWLVAFFPRAKALQERATDIQFDIAEFKQRVKTRVETQLEDNKKRQHATQALITRLAVDLQQMDDTKAELEAIKL